MKLTWAFAILASLGGTASAWHSKKPYSTRRTLEEGGTHLDDYLLECAGYVGNVYGDPHITTFDGVEYSSMVGGEYIMAKNDDIEFQARFEKVGDGQTASSPTGVAVKVPGIDTIQLGFAEYNSGKEINTDPNCPMHLYIDGVLTDLSSDITGSGYKITSTGWSVNIQWYDGSTPTYALSLLPNDFSWPYVCYMIVYFCLPTETAESVGLMGSPDDDTTNEWMTSDGTPLPFSSDAEAAYDYATANHCIADEDDSLFVHEDSHGGNTFLDFMECDVEFPGEVDISEADEAIIEICGEGNIDCIVDGVVAGEAAAVSTKDTQDKITAIKVSNTTVDVAPDTHCAGDITLLATEGNTQYDEIPFTILSQDTDSVTLKLRSLWFDGVNVQYTKYSENFVEKCISETDVTTATFEEITVSCPGSEHVTLITVVGSDSLLDAELDTASVPKCCHADDDTLPKVMYTFMVNCVSQCPSSSRRLRGDNHY